MSLDAHTSDFDDVDAKFQAQYDRWTPSVNVDIWEKLDESLELESIWNKLDESLELESVWNQLEQTIKQEVSPKRSFTHWILGGLMFWLSFQTADQSLQSNFGIPSLHQISVAKSHENQKESSDVFNTNTNLLTENRSSSISPYRDIAKWNILENQPVIAPENLIGHIENTDSQTESIAVSKTRLKIRIPKNLKLDSPNITFSNDTNSTFNFPRPKSPNQWKFGFFASANTAHFDFVDFPMIRQNLPHLGSEFGILVSIPIHKTRLNTQFSFTNLKQNENRYINGKFTSITHQINAFNLSSLIEIPIRKHLNWEIGPSFSAPISSVTRRENVIVGLPRYSNLYAGLRTELNWELRSFLNVGIHYNWLEALKKEDINLIRHQVIGLNTTFLF